MLQEGGHFPGPKSELLFTLGEEFSEETVLKVRDWEAEVGPGFKIAEISKKVQVAHETVWYEMEFYSGPLTGSSRALQSIAVWTLCEA